MIQAKLRGWIPCAHLPFMRLTTTPRRHEWHGPHRGGDVVDPHHRARPGSSAHTAVATEPSRRSSAGTGPAVRPPSGGSSPGSGGAAARASDAASSRPRNHLRDSPTDTG